MAKTALLGFHKEDDALQLDLEMAGYEVTTAESVDEMLEKMSIPKDSAPDASPKNPFDLYCMDVNLGSPNSRAYEPASTIYQHVKKDIEAGNVKFLATSGNLDAVEGAQKVGIPAVDRMKLFDTLLSDQG